MFLFSSVDFFFKINFFKKKNSGTQSECQTVWIQVRPLIWVQSVNIQQGEKKAKIDGCPQVGDLISEQLINTISNTIKILILLINSLQGSVVC